MKRIITLSILLGALFAISPNASAANVSKEELYGAYLNLIEDRLDAVGYSQPSITTDIGNRFGSNSPGVVYAELVDLDNDGQDELYMLEFVDNPFRDDSFPCDLTWFVYTYQNGQVILSKSDQFATALTVRFGISQGRSGKKYIYDYFSTVWNSWELSNGEWHQTTIRVSIAPAYSSSWNIGGQHIHVSSDFGTPLYTVERDGVALIKDSLEYPAQFIDELDDGSKVLFDPWSDRPTDWAPQALMKQLESEYVPSYRIPSKWAQDTVSQSINAGIVPSHLQKNYQRPITRAEFCSLAVDYYENITGATISERATFSDTADINVQKWPA